MGTTTSTGAKPEQKLEPWKDPKAVPYVHIDKVTKRFGDFVAVHQVSLDIYKGEVFCLLGASGCGKTTLLRMLAGFEDPSEGKIYIDGQDMSGCPPYNRPVNMMFQSYALFPHMTVEQNVGFGLRQDKVAKDEIAERVNAMLKLVHLGGYEKRKPNQLSGGQRQRVALARSLIKRPKLLLLDEPLGALDKKLREATQFELLNIQETLGVTFVIVTHDQEEAMTLATRIGVMNSGEILQRGTPTEIYEYPTSKYVADFIGSVNMFQGRIIEDLPDRVRIATDEVEGTIFVDHGVAAPPESTVYVAVRPEKILLSRERPAETENLFAGTVKEIAYMGDVSRYLIKLDGGKILRVTQPNIFRHDDRLVWEERVWVHWHPSANVVVTT